MHDPADPARPAPTRIMDGGVSRRGLFRRSGTMIATGAVLAAGHSLLTPSPARAAVFAAGHSLLTPSPARAAVYGIAVSGVSIDDVGVYGESHSDQHASILGAKHASDANGHFERYGPAILGLIDSPLNVSAAVQGTNKALGPGVFGESTGNGNGVSGVAAGTGSGVYAASTYGSAVLGVVTTSTNGSAAVHGKTSGTGPAVFGEGLAAGNGTSGVAAGSGSGVYGKSDTGRGVWGISRTGSGVVGEITNNVNGNAAVYGKSSGVGPGVLGEGVGYGNGTSGVARQSGSGVYASSDTGRGVSATSRTGIAVVGEITNSANGNAAVYGSSTGGGPGVFGEGFGAGNGTSGVARGTGSGVYGQSVSGRGGLFIGAKAQIRLQPSTASTHPASGQSGDLFVDASHHLWFCRGGTGWVRLD